jgi:hypothetical protein
MMAKRTTIEARLLDFGGEVVRDRRTIACPPMPTIAWLPPRPRMAAPLAVKEVSTLPGIGQMLDPLLFDFVGVEVDMTGTWARYERRK